MITTTSLKAQFDLHTRLYINALEGISDAEANTRGHEHLNHIKWVAGHLLNTRLKSTSKFAGLQPDDTYAALFDRHTLLSADAQYPPMDEITARWQSVSPAISEGLARIPQEVLTAKASTETPIFNIDDTVHGVLAFITSHEAYHIGQLSLLRKIAGKSAMSYR